MTINVCHEHAITAWWRHQMETFSALLALWTGNSPVLGEFPTQMPVTRSFDVFFDLRLNQWLSKQSWGWWFETLSCPLWRHRNGTHICMHLSIFLSGHSLCHIKNILKPLKNILKTLYRCIHTSLVTPFLLYMLRKMFSISVVLCYHRRTKVMVSSLLVAMSVCLFVCWQHCGKTRERIFVKGRVPISTKITPPPPNINFLHYGLVT